MQLDYARGTINNNVYFNSNCRGTRKKSAVESRKTKRLAKTALYFHS